MTTYDVAQLAQLRKNAEFNHVDFSRGRVEPTDSGQFAVRLSAPLVPINDLLDPPPTLSFVTSSALQAEGFMLDNLIKIQRAERQRVRIGRVSSWSVADIVRKPLTPEELTDYKAFIEHRNKVAKLQAELSEALQSKARRESAQASAATIRERYGAAEADPVPVAQEPAPEAQSVETLLAQSAAPYATRRTSRKGK